MRKQIHTTQIEACIDKQQLDEKVEEYINIITEACDASIPKTNAKDSVKLPWWNGNLTKLKKRSHH